MPLVKTLQKRLKAFYNWLRARGLGERTLKTALAVTLAWLLGKVVPGGTDHPYFAPLTAIFSMQTTVADSISGAVQRVLGIIAGVAVALAVSSLIGETAWGIGLIVLLALILGANLHLNSQGVSEVAVSALLVMFFGNASDLAYAGSRLVECSVGAVVGVAVNALLIPPSHLAQARTAAQTLALAITSALDHLAALARVGMNREGALQNLTEGRALSIPLAAAQSALEQAETSLKYNLRSRFQQVQLARCRHIIETLEHIVIQVRGMARTLIDTLGEKEVSDRPNLSLTAPGELNEALSGLFSSLSKAVFHFSEPVVTSARLSSELEQALLEIEQCRQAVYRAASQQMPPLSPEGWMQLGALLSDADRLLNDLALASSFKHEEETATFELN